MWRKFLAALLAIPLCVCMLSGCQGGGASKEKESDVVDAKAKPVDGNLKPLKKPATVVIAEDDSASAAGFYIADAKGYFKDYNINIKFAKFSNSDDMLPALASGKVDVAGGISSASFFNSIAQGIDVKMIADKGHNLKGQSYFSFVVSKRMKNKIKSYKDFKGKKIAVSTKNGVDDYIFSQMLKHAGLSRKDVHFVLMPDFGNMMSAVANGTVDAALQIEPMITQGEMKGIHYRFGDTTDYAPKAQIAMVLGSPNFVNNEHAVALRFMVAYLKGIRDYNDAFVKGKGNKQEIINIMMKNTSLKDPKIWDKVAVIGLDPNGRMFVNNIKDQYKWYKARGGIDGNVDINKAVDTSLAKEAVKVLGPYK
ncbi:NitT/TauT family transport system substrate-binding protein [Scopulibacillus daqui]|uniref:NitT/TauT family transport system substrate-binding protein n=2 Tax=Scopulibacillus daqui TaxID=1469162 RepID=A0ABS2Q0V7_9BACL|nr:NitT/TauT family transport system substrate-binding protein [Scopulibacillus daqui]